MGGGQGRCEQRSEVLCFLWGGPAGAGGVGVRSGVGVGEVADVAYGGCKPRIKGTDKCK